MSENKTLNIKEVKEIFLNSNFFNWKEENQFNTFYNKDEEYDRILKENFFHSIKYIDNNCEKEIKPIEFLHGRCCEFAVALAKRFGYDIVINFDYDDNGEFSQLIHVYCIYKIENNTEFIDVRGIESNYYTENFMVSEPEFEYDWDNNTEIILKADEAIDFLVKNLKLDSSVYDNLEEANEIIDLFEEKYSI